MHPLTERYNGAPGVDHSFFKLFSGSSKLSASMRKRGFKIFPVDHEYNQHHTHVSTICLDLQKHHDQGAWWICFQYHRFVTSTWAYHVERAHVHVKKRCLITSGITISIENPERSWLWTILTQLVLQTQDSSFIRWFGALEKVSFHSCMLSQLYAWGLT